jgi:hypothetical protein
MGTRIAPSESKAQEIAQWFEGQSDPHNGEELLSALVRLPTERVLQEALEQEQTGGGPGPEPLRTTGDTPGVSEWV